VIGLAFLGLLLLALGALLLPDLAFSDHSGLILPPSLGRPDVVWVTGRVVHAQSESGFRVLQTLRRLAAPNWTGAPVEVRFLGRTARTVSGADGEFEVEIPAGGAGGGERFPPGWHPVEVESLGARVEGTVHVVGDEVPFIVISDFDDTLAVSHVTSRAKLLATTFFDDADTHPPVDGMPVLYRSLVDAHAVPPAFAVVTGWPFQFSSRLVRFLEKNRFPRMALFLRNFGPSTLHGYKEPVLRRLASRFRHPLVLVGDSGEQDPEIYAALAREHPGRVKRIYIRKADAVGPATRFEGMCLFGEPSEAVRDAVEAGLGVPWGGSA
jgi:phosphatidate phosphatase APP1